MAGIFPPPFKPRNPCLRELLETKIGLTTLVQSEVQPLTHLFTLFIVLYALVASEDAALLALDRAVFEAPAAVSTSVVTMCGLWLLCASLHISSGICCVAGVGIRSFVVQF